MNYDRASDPHLESAKRRIEEMERRHRIVAVCPGEGCGAEVSRTANSETWNCRTCGAYGIVEPPFACIECGESEDDCRCDHDANQCDSPNCKYCEKAFDQAQERWGLDHFYGPGTSAESSGG